MPPMVPPPGARPSDLDRVRGLARLLATLADSSAPAEFGARLCELACCHLGVDGAALFVGDERPERLAVSGFTAGPPPPGVPASLAAAAIEPLRAWAAGAGYDRLELALLTRQARPAGLLALFSIAGAPLESADLETLGAGVSRALARLEAAATVPGRDERMRALGDLARGIAHDFSNVLNAILGHTGVLAALVGDRPAAADALERLRKVALDGAATLRRVQAFSDQPSDCDFDAVDLRQLVARAGEQLRRRAPAGIRVAITLGSRRPVLGNSAELEELLRALTDNALEAMPDGGTLVLELAPTGDDVALVVGDTGPGLSPSVQRRAFDPFFTTKGARKKGLGLALAYGIVRRHGGLLELDSQPGRGTRARVRFPGLVEAPETTAVDRPAPALSATAAAVDRGRGHRVLLVEDDPDNREAMASLLSFGGFAVTTAECGADGVRAFSADRFDVVLTDLGLPDMDGWRVAGEIKQVAPGTPIALITGWGLNLDRDEIRRRGVDLLVKKPLDPRVFLGQIENLLQAGARKPSA